MIEHAVASPRNGTKFGAHGLVGFLPDLAALAKDSRQTSRLVEPSARVDEVLDVRTQDVPRDLADSTSGQRVVTDEHHAVLREPAPPERKERITDVRRDPRVNAVRDDVIERAVRRRQLRQILMHECDIGQSQFGDGPSTRLDRTLGEIAADELRRRQRERHRNQIRAVVASDFEHPALRHGRRSHAEKSCDRRKTIRMRPGMRKRCVGNLVVTFRERRVARIEQRVSRNRWRGTGPTRRQTAQAARSSSGLHRPARANEFILIR